MNSHPNVRAYLAGVAAPTMFMLVILAAFVIARFAYNVPIPIERALVFPMALVPNVFGVWNILYQKIGRERGMSIGRFGALLPFVLMPMGYTIARTFGLLQTDRSGLVWFGQLDISYGFFFTAFCAGIAIYYLVWKHFVKFFNEVLDLV